MMLKEFKRIIHWGPLIALFIIKSITLMTLYMNAMWWPPNKSVAGFLNQTIFIMSSALTVFNFIMALITGPKYLPLGWRPKNKKHENFLQFCEICQGFKAPRSHHCRKCGRCVKKMDHHCPWINNCVGFGNHSYFTMFLAFAVLGCLHASVILITSLYRGLYRDWYIYYGQYDKATVKLGMWSLILNVFNIGLSVGVIIAVGLLLYFQLRAIIRNRTGIEEWIVDKALYRRQYMAKVTNTEPENFIYPYDLGCMKNFIQVLNTSCIPMGDGISWPVADGCDQYTLTREQLSQKAEKRARTRTYRISKRVTGSWCPFYSQGFVVTCHPPCTDEPRIALEVDDVVNVTRWRKHWLFGEKVEPTTEINSNDQQHARKNGKSKSTNKQEKILPKRNRIKGWFPRQCAYEMIDQFSDDQYEQEESEGNMDNDEKKSN